MSSTTTVGPVPVVDLVGLLRAVVEGLVEGEFWRLSGQESADSLEEMELAFRLLEFARCRELADFHARDIAGQEAGLSTEAFLQARLRLSPAEAKARVRSAHELVGAVSVSGELVEPELPATAGAALSTEHVRAIGQAMKKLPPAVGVRERAEAEEFLAERSRDMDPNRIRVLAKRLHAVLDPDGTLDEDKPERRELIFRPDVGGEKPQVTVTIALDDLRGKRSDDTSLPRPGAGTVGTGAAITAEAARRIACDAAVIPIVLGSQSEPLDIGRATRTIPTGIRRAVVARDIGCVHPGCTAPAAWCQTHHVKHWANGGSTSLNNLAMLCHHHHWVVHHEGWHIVFLKGIPHVIPPPIIDPRRRPRRNTMHDQPGLPSG